MFGQITLNNLILYISLMGALLVTYNMRLKERRQECYEQLEKARQGCKKRDEIIKKHEEDISEYQNQITNHIAQKDDLKRRCIHQEKIIQKNKKKTRRENKVNKNDYYNY